MKTRQKDGGLNPLSSAFNDHSDQQGSCLKRKPDITAGTIIQSIREIRSGTQTHHKRKGGEKLIRQNRRRMTGNKNTKKVAREGKI